MNLRDKKYKEYKLQFHKNKITWDNPNGNYIQGDWDTPHMEFQAEITCRNGGHILEVGFGMGISANHIQRQNIKSHTIIELNDEIYKKAVEWAKDKPNTKIIHGDWKTIELDEKFDSIFFDAIEQTPTDYVARLKFPLLILRFCKVGTNITMYNHVGFAGEPKTLWSNGTFWANGLFQDELIYHKLTLSDKQRKGILSNNDETFSKKDKSMYVNDYYLPEWIITEQDTEDKFKKRLNDIHKK
jgi:hypothetical protein